jgi:hypothetical protein
LEVAAVLKTVRGNQSCGGSTPSPSAISVAYLAGLIDGEGSIMMCRLGGKTRKRRSPVISIGNTDILMISWLVENFGGMFLTRPKTGNHNAMYEWRVKGKTAVSLCRQCLPYLRTKRKQERARLISEEYHLVTLQNGRPTEAEDRARQDFEERFALL